MTITKKIKKSDAVTVVKAEKKPRVSADTKKLEALRAQRKALQEKHTKLVQEYHNVNQAHWTATEGQRVERQKQMTKAQAEYSASASLLRRGYDAHVALLEKQYVEACNIRSPDTAASLKKNSDERVTVSADAQKVDVEIRKLENLGKVAPAKGAFTLYKKCYDERVTIHTIVELRVPAKAKRHCAPNEEFKCRVDEAKVVSIKGMRDGKPLTKALSTYDRSFFYEVGKIVKPKQAFDDRPVACTSGIHGFMQIEDARNY